MPLANPYVATGYVAESYIGARGVIQAKLQEFTWNDFAESNVIDRTWDEWYGDAWDFDGVAFSFSTVIKALGGRLHLPVITSTSQTTLSGLGRFTASGVANPTAVATQSSNAVRVRQLVNENYTGVFNVESFAYAINFGEADWTGSFTTAFNGNSTKNFYSSPTAIFTQTAVGAYGVSAGKSALQSLFTQDADGNYLIARADALLNAFAFELTDGTKILIVDPYLTYKVLGETRMFSINTESRIIECLDETRVNSIKEESCVYLVPEEKRMYKIMKPPFKYRSTIPRVRQES